MLLFLRKHWIFPALATLLTIAAIIGAVRYDQPDRVWAILVLCAMVSGAWIVTAYIAYLWWKAQQSAYVTKHGIVVKWSKQLRPQAEVEAEVDRVLELWTVNVPEANVKGHDYLSGTILTFEPKPFIAAGQCVSGCYWPDRRAIDQWAPSALSNSSLPHELGHAIYHRWTGNIGQDPYHFFSLGKRIP